MKINILAEEIKQQKFQISNYKRNDNFEIQQLRSAFTTSVRKRYNSKPRFESTM